MPNYKFDWAVKDDLYNDFGQYETRLADKTTGNYWVVLPDGRKQVVNYYVDGYSGYVADVQYEGGYQPFGAYNRDGDYQIATASRNYNRQQSQYNNRESYNNRQNDYNRPM